MRFGHDLLEQLMAESLYILGQAGFLLTSRLLMFRALSPDAAMLSGNSYTPLATPSTAPRGTFHGALNRFSAVSH